MYGQTPQFTFSTTPIEGNTRKTALVVEDFPGPSQLQIDFKHGQLQGASLNPLNDIDNKVDITQTLKQNPRGQVLYDRSWHWETVGEQLQSEHKSAEMTKDQVAWLKKMLPSNHVE